MAKRGIKFEHSVGEIVLCFEPDPTKARVLYEAKILDSQVSKDKQGKKCAAYHVHFNGWNNSWDRLVPENYILRANEENKALMKRLTDTAKKHRKNRQRRHKIDQILKEANVKAPPQDDSNSDTYSSSSEDENETHSENDDSNQALENGRKKWRRRQKQPNKPESTQVTIDIPDILKSRLEDDYVAVSIRGKLCSLPAKPCVVDILERFMKTFCINYVCDPQERELQSKERDKQKVEKHLLKLPPENVFCLCKETVDGLRILFDFTLPIILLYASEQEQYESIMRNTKPEDLLGEGEKVSSLSETKVKHGSGRPPGKHKQTDKEEVEEMTSDTSMRRQTRSHAADAHSPDEPAAKAVVPHKRHKRQEASNSPKLSPRALRRRGIHEEPLTVKVENNSDTEIEFSPLASTSSAHNGSHLAWTQAAKALSGGTEPGGACSSQNVAIHKEDLTDSILSWQLLPWDIRHQPPVYPSQIYGIHHLLRLFVKLPQLLNRMPFENNKLQILGKLCHHCLQYLVDHQQEYFV